MTIGPGSADRFNREDYCEEGHLENGPAFLMDRSLPVPGRRDRRARRPSR